MAIRRREFLLGATAGVLGAAGGFARGGFASSQDVYAGCQSDAAGNHYVTLFELSGTVRAKFRLPGRGHGVALDARSARAVVLARRPGTFAVVLDLASGRVLQSLRSSEDRHFGGHGVFSFDGRYLYTTEIDYQAGRGTIGIRDANRAYRQVGEFSSYGIGPHELRLMPDATTLAVANGGIRTHPDTGRAKLNVDSMQPSLVFVDVRNGERLRETALEPRLHKLSIRHIDVSKTGDVAIAMQYQGSKRDRVPLVALWRDGTMVLFRAPPAIERRMRHYTASVAFDTSAQYLAVSCPRGNLVTFWETQHGRYLDVCDIPDGSGVAAHRDAGAFILTGRDGGYTRFDVTTGRKQQLQSHAAGLWDNHLSVAISLT